MRPIVSHPLSRSRRARPHATPAAVSDLARGHENGPFYLDELTGLRLALILIAVKPLCRHDRIETIGQGISMMSAEEAYYWFSKCSAGTGALRAQKALRVLLAEE